MNKHGIPNNPSQSIENSPETIVVLWGGGKRRVLWLIEYMKQHPTIKNIIFSWWKTAGVDKPSEAEAMRTVFLKKFTWESAPHIILEEDSRDTEENAEEVSDLIQGFNNRVEEIVLMSDTTHLPRAWWAFERRGIPVTRASAEYWLSKRSKHHKKYVRNLFFWKPYLKQTFLIEPLVHILSSFEKWRKYIRKKTQWRV